VYNLSKGAIFQSDVINIALSCCIFKVDIKKYAVESCIGGHSRSLEIAPCK